MPSTTLEVQGLSFPIFATFGLYALVMVAIGFYFWRQTKDPEQFFLGGRNMGPTVSALSAGASDMSSWLLMGLPGALYIAGLINAWIAIGLSIGAFLNWVFVAKRLRIYTEVIANSITIPDYFETRFSDDKHILRLISAIVILVFFVFYISSGLIAGAKLFEQTFHIDYSIALIVGASIIVIYTFFGGYLAVCWTDLLQGLLMMIALIIVPIVMLYHIGGFGEAVKYLEKSDTSFNVAIENIKDDKENLNTLFAKLRDSNSKGEAWQNLMELQTQMASIRDTLKDEAKRAASARHKDVGAFMEKYKDMDSITESFKKDLDKLIGDITSMLDSLSAKNHFSFFNGVTLAGVISALAWGLGYFGQPHIIVRFMSIRSTRDIPKATFIGISWMVISLIGACLVGILGVAYITKYDLSFSDPETIFIVMSQTLFNPWLTGIFLSALLAAIMSTASSQLLVSASTVAEDFYKKILKTEATSKQVMFFSRASVLVVSLVAFFISTDKDSSILSIVAYAWAGFGASFGSVILFSLFWRRMTRMGAIAGMAVGAIVVVLHKNFLYDMMPIYEIVPGFVCASIAIIVVSLLQPVRPGTKAAYDKLKCPVGKA